MSTEKWIPVFINPEQFSLKIWSEVEASLPKEWRFQYLKTSQYTYENIVNRFIIVDAEIGLLKEFLFHQRSFAVPFIYVFTKECTAEDICNVKKLGAEDVICAPLSKSELEFKIKHYFSHQSESYKNEIFTQGNFTQIEENILSVLLKKTVVTTAPNICVAVWGSEDKSKYKTFNVHISKIRKKVAPFGIDIKMQKDKSYHLVKKKSLSTQVLRESSLNEQRLMAV